MIADPFGKNNGSLATLTVPSGSTFASTALCIAAPAIRSNPKLPTYAVPSATDDHVVDVPGRHAAQVGVLDELAGRLVSQQTAIAHRHDRAVRPSGSQPEPRRLVGAPVTISSGSLARHAPP